MRQKRKNKRNLLLTILVLIIAVSGWLFNENYEENPERSSTETLTIATTNATTNATTILPTSEPAITVTKQPTKTPLPTTDIPELKVHFIDVGQADCILIETEGYFMLVDGGNNDDKKTIVDYLTDMGVTRLEYVIGTHPHEDHIGSLDVVIETFEIGKVYAPYVEHTSTTYYDFLMSAVRKEMGIIQPDIGTVIKLGRCEITFIAPNKDYKSDLNNWSMGVKISNGAHSFVMCGDVETEAESDVLTNGIDITGDVLKLSHHGSSTSNTDEFLEAVAPKYAVITCGTNNSYGHPHKETMDKLKKLGIPFFRTDEQGTVIATSNGETLTWNVSPSTNYKSGNE